MTGATSSTDGTSGSVPAPEAGEQGKFLRGDATWAEVPSPLPESGSGFLKKSSSTLSWDSTTIPQLQTSINNLSNSLSRKIIEVFTMTGTGSIPIPATGSGAVRYDVAGMTADYEVIRWNFSSSAENNPPCDLTVITYDGYFTVQNTGGSTNESFNPVFAVPSLIGLE
jgi:hypothetical protein